MHIPDDPLYYEKFYFTPGDLGFKSWDTQKGKLGVCVCWDQWFPESRAADGAQRRATPVLPHRHRLASRAKRSSSATRSIRVWETIQRGHAIANGCYVAAVNRVGHEAPAGGAGIEFWGQSFLCDPAGQIIAKAGVHDEEIVLADIDFARVEEQRTHWPFLRDRRIDAYADITRRLID